MTEQDQTLERLEESPVNELLSIFERISPGKVTVASIDPAVFTFEDGKLGELGAASEYFQSPECIDWMAMDISSRGLSDLSVNIEITHKPSSSTIHLVPRSEYKAFGPACVQSKNKKINDLTKEYCEGAVGLEQISGEVLRGKVPFVVPVLAGLKPCGFFSCDIGDNERMEPYLKAVAQITQGNFKVKRVKDPYYPHEDVEDLLFYNLARVKEIYKTHQSIFDEVLGHSVENAEEVIDAFVVHTSTEKEYENRKRMFCLGLLLGYDESSVKAFEADDPIQQFKKVSLPMWGVNYLVSNPQENSNYKTLKAKYDALRKAIEQDLEEGTAPSAILEKLSLKSLAQSIGDQAKQTLKISASQPPERDA